MALLDDTELKSTRPGNRSVYRTRMAIADGGELVALTSGVDKCGGEIFWVSNPALGLWAERRKLGGESTSFPMLT